MQFIEVETTEKLMHLNVANISHFYVGSTGKAFIGMMNGEEIKTTQTVQKLSSKIATLTKKAEFA